MKVAPVQLEGKTVHLVPLSADHVPGLTAAGKDPSIWAYLPYGELTTVPKMEAHVAELLDRAHRGVELPFTVIHLKTGEPIGCTRYLEIRRQHRSLEIGGTWYAKAFQRTRVNTECKYLLLGHAFETLGCIRVEFKTDARNEPSRKALQRIGAVREGVHRNHMIIPGGRIRDSVYYSIIDSEWPGVKARLESLLAARVEGTP